MLIFLTDATMQAKQLAQKRAGAFYTETSTIIVSMPRVSLSVTTTRRHHQRKQFCDIGKKNNIKILIRIDFFHFDIAEMLSC